MLNRNGKAVLKYQSGQGYSFSYVLKNTAGNEISNNVATAAQRSTFFGALSMMVGSGTTEPTKDDYRLESQENGLSVVSSSSTAANTPSYQQNYILNYTRTYKNNTESPITISEVGLYFTYDNNTFLITRDTFEPVVIQPNDIYVVSVTIG